MATTMTAELARLTPAEIDQIPWEPVTGLPGVSAKELWRAGDFVHALIKLAPGARAPGYAHLAAHHFIWLLAGEAMVAGRRMPAGSCVHVPPGVAHPVEAAGPQGCTLLQVHTPYATPAPH